MTAIDRRGHGGRDDFLTTCSATVVDQMIGTARAAAYGNAVVIRMLADMVTARPGERPDRGPLDEHRRRQPCTWTSAQRTGT